jgi:hypothetical protein
VRQTLPLPHRSIASKADSGVSIVTEGERLNETPERRFKDTRAANRTRIAKALLQLGLGQFSANQLASRAAPEPFGFGHFSARRKGQTAACVECLAGDYLRAGSVFRNCKSPVSTQFDIALCIPILFRYQFNHVQWERIAREKSPLG